MGDRKLVAVVCVATVTLQACTPAGSGGGAPKAPPEPVLNAVLLPGAHLTFARVIADRTYEALPSASIILRLTSAWPLNGERVRVTLVPVSPPPQPGPLPWVRSDDLPRKQQLASTGYFETVVDGFGYSVVVTPAPDVRNSPGFNLVVSTTAGGTPANPAAESAPIIVTIRPRSARTLPSAVFFDCDASSRGPGSWYNTCKNSGSIVLRDVVLQGWLRGPAPNWFGGNNDPIWIEDWHYDFELDPDFIAQMYGPQGAFPALGDSTLTAATTVLRGNPPSSGGTLQLVDRAAQTGQPIGITVNSFIQPDNRANLDDAINSEAVLKAELNAWHENNQGSPRCVEFFQQCRHWIGRSTPPDGWIRLAVDSYSQWSVHPSAPDNTYWPYDPRAPLVGAALVADDYVRVAGTLWQDTDHGGVDRWTRLRPGMGAWLELHPVDWIARVPAPAVRKAVRIVERINWEAVDFPESRTLEPPAKADASHVLRCRELVDGRFTWPASLVQHSTSVTATNVVVQTTVRRAVAQRGLPGLQPGRFKATYILWWEAGQPESGCRPG